jgi:hypothetical protein
MKIMTRTSDFTIEKVGAEIFGKLIGIFRENVVWREGRPPQLTINVPVDDPRLRLAQEMLAAAGWTVWKERDRNCGPREYSIDLGVVYEPSDWDPAQYLQPKPLGDAWFGEYFTDPDGRLVIEDRYGNRKGMGKPIVGLAVEWQHILVVPRVRAILQEANLSHLQFKETRLVDVDGEPMSWPDEPYWELTSDLRIPPPIYQGPAKSDEPTPRVAHFRQSELSVVGPFDLAVAPFPGSLHTGFLVASKAFFRVCVEHDLRFDWIPVQIDG